MDQSIITVGIHWETSLNNNLEINNERQDYKIGTVGGGYLWEGGGWMKEIKVKDHGWWTAYTCMK
jgi:hypothetical protein